MEVGDVNDNFPVCPRLLPMQLDRRTEVGTMVTILEVTDADIGINAEIEFVGIRGEFAPQFLEVRTQNRELQVFTSK